MTRFLLRLTPRAWSLLALVVMIGLCVFQAFAQDGTPTPAITDVPVLLYAPLIVGMLAHWLKGFSRGTITVSLWQYVLQNLGQTFSAIGTAIVAFNGMYLLNPAAYPLNFGGLFGVFLIGYTSDSILNGTGSFIKK